MLVGGELRSQKGLNLPGINLGVSAFTQHDQDCMMFALENGVDAVSQSFVETQADVTRCATLPPKEATARSSSPRSNGREHCPT